MLKKVLVADDDLDVHELVHDILQINFKQVKVDRALSSKSFLKKLDEADDPYDLILFNVRLNENGNNCLSMVQQQFPNIMERIILLADSPDGHEKPLSKNMPCVSKPFSLDHFGEVIKKVCSA
jgi:DNA-binding NtrC family response regulator